MVHLPYTFEILIFFKIKLKAGEGGGGGQNTWAGLVRGPEILVKRLVMVATVKMVGDSPALIKLSDGYMSRQIDIYGIYTRKNKMRLNDQEARKD